MSFYWILIVIHKENKYKADRNITDSKNKLTTSGYKSKKTANKYVILANKFCEW
jgi:hypothetical protein